MAEDNNIYEWILYINSPYATELLYVTEIVDIDGLPAPVSLSRKHGDSERILEKGKAWEMTGHSDFKVAALVRKGE